MDTSKKIIRGTVSGRWFTITSAITQWDYGWIFIPGIESLPPTYRLDFSNEEKHGTALPVYCGSEGAEVPTELIDTGKDIWVWFVRIGEGYGITEYKWRVPNKCKPKTEQDEPTPSQQSSIDQAISVVNDAVEQAEQSASDASQSAQSAQGYAEQAEQARDTAQTYANNAQTSATSAQTSASQASASASASAQSASQSAQIKADVEDLADDAQGYAQASAQSASASANSASQAQGFAQSASASAQSASGYANNAQSYSQTASAKAQDASTSAQTASEKASEASQSATTASNKASEASGYATASQTAQGLAESARDSAISAKNDAEQAKADAESARDEAVQAVASISGALDDKADIITDTASGSIASFTDGADDLPLKSLVIDINPVQDLHGQDAPYPAGGGVNLLDPAKCSVIGRVGTYDLTVTHDQATAIWTISGTPTAQNASLGFNFCTYSDFSLSGKGYQVQAFPISGTPIKNVYGFRNETESRIAIIIDTVANPTVNVTFKVSVAATAQTAWSPYSNICPISGWTEVNVNHSDADMTNPTTITIDLGQTVYGGKLDVLTGVLTVDRAMVDLGAKNWYPSTAAGCTRFRTSITDIERISSPNVRASLLCSNYPTKTANQTYQGTTGVSLQQNSADIYIYDPQMESMTGGEFKSAMSGVQLCYELATPQTYQLTPTEVATLLGDNTIWADTGDTEVEYRTDPDLYIQRKMPEVPVDDVQINGTSIVENGVANVPIASDNVYGVVKTSANRGVLIGSDGALGISGAGAGYTKNGATTSYPLIPANQHISTFYGLSKAAGADERNSTLPVGEYSEEAKVAIQKMLGINQQGELLADITATEDVTEFLVNTDLENSPFELKKMIVIFTAGVSTTGTCDAFYVQATFTNKQNSTFGTSCPSLTYPTATSGMVARLTIDVFDGMPLIPTAVVATGDGNSQSVLSMVKQNIAKNIKGIRIYQSSTTKSLIPAGSNIKVYGIRA